MSSKNGKDCENESEEEAHIDKADQGGKQSLDERLHARHWINWSKWAQNTESTQRLEWWVALNAW